MTGAAKGHYRRNLAMVVLDHMSFSVGMTFMGWTTILPSLVKLLGGSPIAVGSLSAIQAGGWLLPQLLASRYVANQPLVKKYILVPAAASRLTLFALPPILTLCAVRAPRLALAALLLGIAAFSVADALSAAGWFDLLAKLIPPEQRGRVLGGAQSLASLIGIGAGLAVEAILARRSPFLADYALLLLLGAISLSVGIIAVAFVREPSGRAQGRVQLPWREYLPHLRSILGSDARFVWVTLTGWAAGLADMVAAFYVLYAMGRLHMPERMIGLFVSAGVVGGLLSGIVLGPIGDRRGAAQVITLLMGLRCASPALALLAPLVAGYHPWLAPGAFIAVFASMGVINGAFMVGFNNYLLHIAPPGQSSIYVALFNTLGAPLALAPLAAGWLVQSTSYELLFALSLGLAAIGFAISLRRPGEAGLAVGWERSGE